VRTARASPMVRGSDSRQFARCRPCSLLSRCSYQVAASATRCSALGYRCVPGPNRHRLDPPDQLLQGDHVGSRRALARPDCPRRRRRQARGPLTIRTAPVLLLTLRAVGERATGRDLVARMSATNAALDGQLRQIVRVKVSTDLPGRPRAALSLSQRSSTSADAGLPLSRNGDGESTDRKGSGSPPGPTAATPGGLSRLTIGMRPLLFDQSATLGGQTDGLLLSDLNLRSSPAS
jgi:hypothetical protein